MVALLSLHFYQNERLGDDVANALGAVGVETGLGPHTRGRGLPRLDLAITSVDVFAQVIAVLREQLQKNRAYEVVVERGSVKVTLRGYDFPETVELLQRLAPDLARDAETRVNRTFAVTIEAHFGLEDLRALVFDLGEDYDSIEGNTKSTKVRALIEYMRRRGRYDELVEACRKARPNGRWDVLADD